jgi:predicted RNase H-like nuclease (RuvC/YqgF family)
MIRSVFGFKTRNPGRDSQTDTARFLRVQDMLSGISEEMQRERAGLEKRYGTVAADAAFLFEALENEPEKDSSRIAELTDTLQSCERRIAALKKQMLFMEDCRRIVSQFAEDNDIALVPAKVE